MCVGGDPMGCGILFGEKTYVCMFMCIVENMNMESSSRLATIKRTKLQGFKKEKKSRKGAS